jgi:hypothetical protein
MDGTLDRAIDPVIPQGRLVPNGKRGQPHNRLQMLAIAILLCCLVKGLAPELTGQVIAAAPLSSARNLGVLLVAWVLSVIWHELGHLITALLVGFDVVGIAFGPIRASRIDGSWSTQISGRSPFAASISAVPHRSSAFDTATWRNGMLIVVAGGPLATLVGAAASLLALQFATLTPADSCFFAFAAELNVLIFLLGLVPNRPDSPIRNDTSLFLALLRGGSDAHAILLYHLISQVRKQGFRPCFYPEHMIRAIARAYAPAEFRVLFAQTVCEWALDRGRVQTAEAWDRHALDLATSCNIRIYTHAMAHSACLDWLLRQDRAAAGAKCAEITLASISPEWLQHRSKSVAFLTKGNILEAMGEMQRAEFCFPAGVPYFEFQKHLIDRLRQTAKVLSDAEIPLPEPHSGTPGTGPAASTC